MTASNLEEILPLTPLQEGLLYHATAAGRAGDAYTMQLVLDLDGPLDAGRLRDAADALLRRHPALRVLFALDSGAPWQIQLRDVTPGWRVVDVTGDAERERAAAAEREAGFDLERPPLIRFLLLRSGPHRHHLVITNHHIVLDGWSVPLLVRDLLDLYAGRRPPEVRPFRDFLGWLRERDRDAALRAWADALSGLAEPTLLAGGAPAPAAERPLAHRVELTADRTARLTATARELGVTLGTVLQTAWAVLLGRLTHRDDVVFGTTVSGRPADLTGAESMVGLFVTTVPVRVRLRPGESLAGLLRRVQDEQARLLEHQHVGLGAVQRAAGIGELFDTLVVVESYPVGRDALAGAQRAAGLTIRDVSSHDATHYPVVLAVSGTGRPVLTLKYRTSFCDDAGARSLLDRLRRVLDAMADAPDRPLAAVDVLAPAERHRLTAGVNDTDAAVPPATLDGLFRARVAERPSAVAVACGAEEVTYAELDRRAGRLARHLRGLGAGAEDVVGVHLDRSVDLVVSLLAVLRAGAAFVPLEPALPVARIAENRATAHASIVLTATPYRAAVPAGVRIVDVTDLPDPPGGPGSHAAAVPPPDGLAYVIFTSGSTGRPKGAMIRHGAIAARLLWQRGMLGFGPGDAALFKAPLGFDISINEIFLPLVTGARLVVAAPGEERDPGRLLDLIRQHRVTFTYLVSTMLEAILALPGVRTVPDSLTHVWCGGEVLTPELFGRFRAALPAATLHHGYGPAEATIGVSHELYPPGAVRDAVTIGRTNPNTRVYVLDDHLHPAPPGARGEIYVGGLPLGRGYVGDPRRTAERFVADPFGAPGERLYRTGDLGSWRDDGRLAFHGRADHQVKIRGMRVELQEIDAVLARHPSVRQAVVTTVTGPGGGTALSAHCVPADRGVDPEAVRAWLSTRLPAHMVPQYLTITAGLPVLPSGKIDRNRLPAPDTRPRAGSRPPSGPVEEELCRAFARVLGVDDVGADDSFFELGGHSVLAVRLVSLIGEQLGRTPPVRALLETPTPAGLARALRSDRPDRPAAGPGAFAPVLDLRVGDGRRDPLFCFPPALGLSWSYAGLLPYLDGDRPVIGLQATLLGPDTTRPVSVPDLADRYRHAVLERHPHGPCLLLGWSLGANVAHAVACRLQRDGHPVGGLVLIDGFPGGQSRARADAAPAGRSRLFHRWLALTGATVTGLDPDAVTAADVRDRSDAAGTALSGLPEPELDELADRLLTAAGVPLDTEPGVFDGDVLVITAGRGDRPRGTAAGWEPYVTGRVVAHVVDAAHDDLLTPPALDETGPLVGAHLRAPGRAPDGAPDRTDAPGH